MKGKGDASYKNLSKLTLPASTFCHKFRSIKPLRAKASSCVPEWPGSCVQC